MKDARSIVGAGTRRIDRHGGYYVSRARLIRRRNQPAIIVAGTPRSGTTWIGDTLARVVGATSIFEPLHPTQTPAGAAGFGWWESSVSADNNPDVVRYLQSSIDGRVANRWTLADARLSTLAPTSRLVIKSVRANGLLTVLTELSNCLPPLVVVRHPVAVVASQLNQGSWSSPESLDLSSLLTSVPAASDLIAQLSEPEEFLAAQWALETLPLYTRPATSLVVHFEDVRSRPGPMFDQICSTLGVEQRRTVDWSAPSRTATAGAIATSHGGQLTAAQQDRVLAIVRELGIEAYDQAVEPTERFPFELATSA